MLESRRRTPIRDIRQAPSQVIVLHSLKESHFNEVTRKSYAVKPATDGQNVYELQVDEKGGIAHVLWTDDKFTYVTHAILDNRGRVIFEMTTSD